MTDTTPVNLDQLIADAVKARDDADAQIKANARQERLEAQTKLLADFRAALERDLGADLIAALGIQYADLDPDDGEYDWQPSAHLPGVECEWTLYSRYSYGTYWRVALPKDWTMIRASAGYRDFYRSRSSEGPDHSLRDGLLVLIADQRAAHATWTPPVMAPPVDPPPAPEPTTGEQLEALVRRIVRDELERSAEY